MFIISFFPSKGDSFVYLGLFIANEMNTGLDARVGTLDYPNLVEDIRKKNAYLYCDVIDLFTGN